MMRRAATLGAVLLAAGCLSSSTRDRPFSRDWADGVRREQEFQSRKRHIGEGEMVLLGKKGKTRAAVEMDESGRAQMNVGKKQGLSTDLKVGDDESEVKVKYRIGW